MSKCVEEAELRLESQIPCLSVWVLFYLLSEPGGSGKSAEDVTWFFSKQSWSVGSL